MTVDGARRALAVHVRQSLAAEQAYEAVMNMICNDGIYCVTVQAVYREVEELNSVTAHIFVNSQERITLTFVPVSRIRLVVGLARRDADLRDADDPDVTSDVISDVTTDLTRWLDDHWDVRRGNNDDDLGRLARHCVHLSRATSCASCSGLSLCAADPASEGLCFTCLSRCEEADLRPDAKAECVCCVCMETMPIQVSRTETKCCKQWIHKRCLKQSLRADDEHRCPLCRKTHDADE